MFNNSARSRRWVFTLNNPSLDDLATLNGWPYRYMVWQKERGESGTPHYQGFVIFHQAKSLSVLKTKMHDRAHWEMMRGTLEQNIKYCSKDEGASTARGSGVLNRALVNDLILMMYLT